MDIFDVTVEILYGLLDILVISDTYMVLWILFDDNVATVCNNGNLPLCKGAGQALPNVDQRAFKDKRIREMRKARYIHANIRGIKTTQGPWTENKCTYMWNIISVNKCDAFVEIFCN